MSSHVNTHYHFKTIHKSLLKWWRDNGYDYDDYIKRKMEKMGVHFYEEETPVTIEEHVWTIVRHMIEAQVACVAFQYQDHLRNDETFADYVSGQTKAIITSAKTQDRCPSYVYPGLHKIFACYMYQCEIENFDNLEEDELEEYNVEHYRRVIEFVDWLIRLMADQYIKKQHGHDQAPWDVGPDDLLASGSTEPIMIIGPE